MASQPPKGFISLARFRGFEGCVTRKWFKIKGGGPKVFTTAPYLASWPEAVIRGDF